MSKATPDANEVYTWRRARPQVPYYAELIALRRKNLIGHDELQELLWNLDNHTRWEDYPARHRATLARVDPHAATKLPSHARGRAYDLMRSSLDFLPGTGAALDALDFVEGRYYALDEFKNAAERVRPQRPVTHPDELAQIEGTNLFSRSESRGFSSQDVVLYNPTDAPQVLTLSNYYLSPERTDVQDIGIAPPVVDPKLAGNHVRRPPGPAGRR